MSSTNLEDDYEQVIRKKLKIKGEDSQSKKKKKKDKEKKKLVEVTKIVQEQTQYQHQAPPEIHMTKAELAFEKMREKTQMERIKQKASKTHKQRVEEFNRHLDSLTEHFDVPKVSWTK